MVNSEPPHLLLALSGHGYGHLAQCAPVVNHLQQALPGLVLSICGSLPRDVVASRINGGFEYRQTALDPVLCMLNAWEVDVSASRQVYRTFHGDWNAGLQSDIDLLEQTRPDLLLADIPYRILSAAAQCRIPAAGLCSLNWAAIYAAYCEDSREDRYILEQMLACYRSASLFITPAPAIPMPELDNVVTTGPIARQGCRGRQRLLEHCAADRQMRMVLVALGGISTALPVVNWPVIEGVVWIFTEAVQSQRDDLVDFSSLDLSFIDVLASVDVVLTKPGYGTYTEAVCNGIPVLTIERRDWPEATCLNHWARQHGHLEIMTREQFFAGDFTSQVKILLARKTGPGIEPDGIRQAADRLLSLI